MPHDAEPRLGRARRLLARLRELASSLMNDKVPEARDAARKMGSKLAGQ